MKKSIKFIAILLASSFLVACAPAGDADKTKETTTSRQTSTTSLEDENMETENSLPRHTEVADDSPKRIRTHVDIRGVNLGSWLLLERWMVPELFEENNAQSNDEYRFMEELADRKEEVMHEHYQTFITEEDFAWLEEHGINNVRIPVGYWIFDGKDHFVANIEYLDLAFEWANKYNIKVLIDLHGVRDSQNGFDNSGLEGHVGWHLERENIDEAVEVLEQLTIRYKDDPALFGIAVLNEPSWEIPIDILKDFYLESYEVIMQYLDKTKHWVVIHDGFRLKEWKDFMQGDTYNNVILDTHLYHVFEDSDNNLSVLDQIRKAAGQRNSDVAEMSEYFPIVVGEWSLGLHADKLAAVGTADQQFNALRSFGSTQLTVYGQSSGWYFWSYKQSPKATGSGSGWSFRSAVENGWLPDYFGVEQKD